MIVVAVTPHARAHDRRRAGSTSSPRVGARRHVRRQALALHARPDAERAIRFFAFSNVYLLLLFVAVAVDTLVRDA